MKWLGITLLAGTLALMLSLSSGSKSLITGEAPRGGQSLQFPDSPLEVDRILWSWTVRDALALAKTHIKMDFPFIPFYAGLLVYVCLALRRKLAAQGALKCQALAVPFAVAGALAAPLDALENFGMLRFIDNFEHQLSSPEWLVQLVFASALTKYVLIVGCLLGIAALDVCRVANQPRSGHPKSRVDGSRAAHLPPST